jgi:predicted small integral membrane protein
MLPSCARLKFLRGSTLFWSLSGASALALARLVTNIRHDNIFAKFLTSAKRRVAFMGIVEDYDDL